MSKEECLVSGRLLPDTRPPDTRHQTTIHSASTPIMQTTIVVPCHNEARRLQAAEFQAFVAEHRGVRFLYVNDGSSDDTLALLEKLVDSNPTHFAALNLPKNGGKAEAIRQGVQHSVLNRTDFIGFWDADLATPLDEIPGFVDVLNRRPEIAIVIGSRVPLLGHDIQRRPIRRLLGELFSRVTSLVLGVHVRDTQCGAKLFRATPEILAAFSQPFSSRWIFDVELLARMISLRNSTPTPHLRSFPIPHSPFPIPFSLRHSVYERPLDHWQDVAGSKLKRGDFFKAIAELSAIWWRYLRPGAAPFTPAPLPLATLAPTPSIEPRRAA
jgi:dolichyl-phosphate beta-glucosyltransferase